MAKSDKKIFIKVSISLLILLASLLGIFLIDDFNIRRKREISENIINEINKLCNDAMSDLEGNEEKYKNLLKEEKDPIKRGMYFSALVQINVVRGNSKEVLKYGLDAIEEYKKVDNGNIYAVNEGKHLAWIMIGFGKYSEGFSIANELIEIMSSEDSRVMSEEEIKDSEALIYSIFLIINSEFGLKTQADLYYNKIIDIENSVKLTRARKEKLAYSKMLYAFSIKDYKLMETYAQENYKISLEKDKIDGTNNSKAILLNLALANISNGKLDEAYKQLQDAEEFFRSFNDEQNIAAIYIAYASYYEKIKNYDKSVEYYNKAIDTFIKIEDYGNLKEVLEELINLDNNNNLNLDIKEKHEMFFELNQEINTNKEFKALMDKVLSINDKMNKNKLEYTKSKTKVIERQNLILSTMVLVLIVTIYRTWYLYREKRKSEKILAEIVDKDYLTGALTRSAGYKKVNELLNKNIKLSLAMIDLDNFKKINDTYGHILGDEVLKRLAEVFIKNLGQNHVVIRFGGEEFIIIFNGIEKNEAKALLDSLREEVASLDFKNDISLTFSAGIEDLNVYGLDKTIEKADKLLYLAKKTGKSKTVIEQYLLT